MSRTYIDVTEEESHWNGETGIAIRDSDGITGHDMSLAFGDVELVLTVSQAVTLFDLLDGWCNGGPIREVGGVKRRIHDALRELVKDRGGLFKRLFGTTYTEENFVVEIQEYIKMQGLRFRMKGDEPAFDTLRDRAERERKRRGERAQAGKTEGGGNDE